MIANKIFEQNQDRDEFAKAFNKMSQVNFGVSDL